MSSITPEKDFIKSELESILIPEKRYFTISEVAKLCDIKPHVLRYWEQEFPKLKPNKRRGNRRYYVKEDVLLIQRIKALLYDQGFTLAGARRQLKQETIYAPPVVQTPAPSTTPAMTQQIRCELEDVLELLTA